MICAHWHGPCVTGFHVPVLADAVCDALAPALQGSGSCAVDLTCGGAGHVIALARHLHALGRALPRMIASDRDPAALAHAKQAIAEVSLDGADLKVELIQASFADLQGIFAQAGIQHANTILADIGVSSHQLDVAERGFSFMRDGPLDMRMDPTSGQSAAEFLATTTAEELCRVLWDYGEEPDARRIAAAIVGAPPSTTRELAELVDAHVSPRTRRALAGRVHTATRTFQAIRIAVNDELGQLRELLSLAPALLAEHGRLAIITFHSLEDRMVKQTFRRLSSPPPTPKGLPVRADEIPAPAYRLPDGFSRGVTASQTELDVNPRARSARLRVIERNPA